jgi:hypothetical protein
MKEQLKSFVEQLKSDRRISSFDEAATKQAVLLKVLSLLGWDTFNIDEVVPEYAVGTQRVDYSLRNSNTNKVFIEVKKVGEDLDKHQEQLLNYSFKEGVKLAVLTNGVGWRFYLPLYEGSWEQRKFYTIEIYDQESGDIADRFIGYLEKENVCSGKSAQNAEAVYKSRQKDYLIHYTLPKAWDRLISTPDELLVELISDATEKLCGHKPDASTVEKFILSDVASIVPRSTSSKAKEIIKEPLNKIENYKGMGVSSFVFRGDKYEVKYWIEILTKLANIISNLHRSDFEEVLQLKGSKRPYFTKKADELRIPIRVGDSDIYMETNLSSTMIMKICLNLIGLFGYSAKDFSVEIMK